MSTSVASTESEPTQLNPNIANYFNSMETHENQELDQILAKAIFSSDSSLSLVENEYWHVLFSKLKPNYKLPSKAHLTNTLLENEYESVKNKIKNKITSATSLGLQCCTQSNVAVINFIVTTPHPVFYKTIGTKTERHTPEFLTIKIEEILIQIGIGKFQAIIIDNDPIMIKATALLGQKYRHLAVYICASDILNVLFSDILYSATVARVEQTINEIIKEINTCQILRSNLNLILREKNPSDSLKLANKTFFDSLKSLLTVKDVLQNFLLNENYDVKLSNRNINLILNHDYWVTIQKIHHLFYPIFQWITVLKSENTRLSMVVECFKELHRHLERFLPDSPLTNTENASILRVFHKRRRAALKNIHFAANMLDPRYNGDGLNTDEQLNGMEFIDDQVTKMFDPEAATEIIRELSEYRAKEGFFGNSYVKKSSLNVDSVVWWKGTCFNSKLGKIAVNLLQMPATNVAKDNSYNVIHRAEQNMLSLEKAGKLTFVSNNLRFLKKFEYRDWKQENGEEPEIDEYQKHISFQNEDEAEENVKSHSYVQKWMNSSKQQN